jgi:hypothetical protein
MINQKKDTWTDWMLLLSVFSAAAFGYLMNATGWITMIPGDLGDSRFNSVVLEHLYQWVTGVVSKLWSPRFFFPFEYTLAFSDSHFGSGWGYILFRIAGLPREEAYLGWFLLGAILNFWVCWYVLRRLGFSVGGAAAGAFVFAFALPALHKENHAQLVYRFAIPLAAAAWYWALTQRTIRYFTHAVFWVCVQFLCSIYLGVFLLYLLLAMLGAHIFLGFSQSRHRNSTDVFDSHRAWFRTVSGGLTIAITVLVAITVLLMLRRYQHVAAEYGFTRPLAELFSMLPRPGSYLLADHSSLSGWVGRNIANIPMRPEQQMFVGIGPGILMLIGAARCWLQSSQGASTVYLSRIMSISLLLLVSLTLLVADHTIYAWLAKLPGVASIRAVSRIALVMLLPCAVLVALAVDWILHERQSSLTFKCLGVSGILIALVLESLYYKPYHTSVQSWRTRQDKLTAVIGPIEKDAILLVTQTRAEPFFMTEIDAMIYAQDHHLATLNGYSGNTPPRYTYPDPCLSPEMRIDAYFALRGPSPAKRQQILERLRPVTLEACLKTPASQ